MATLRDQGPATNQGILGGREKLLETVANATTEQVAAAAAVVAQQPDAELLAQMIFGE